MGDGRAVDGASAALHLFLVRHMGLTGEVVANAIEDFVDARLGRVVPGAGPGLASAKDLQKARAELRRVRGGR